LPGQVQIAPPSDAALKILPVVAEDDLWVQTVTEQGTA